MFLSCSILGLGHYKIVKLCSTGPKDDNWVISEQCVDGPRDVQAFLYLLNCSRLEPTGKLWSFQEETRPYPSLKGTTTALSPYVTSVTLVFVAWAR